MLTVVIASNSSTNYSNTNANREQQSKQSKRNTNGSSSDAMAVTTATSTTRKASNTVEKDDESIPPLPNVSTSFQADIHDTTRILQQQQEQQYDIVVKI